MSSTASPPAAVESASASASVPVSEPDLQPTRAEEGATVPVARGVVTWTAVLIWLLIIVVVALIVLALCTHVRYKRMTLRDWSERNRSKHSKILGVMKKVCAALSRGKIAYCLHDGTLLGAARHNGFIPWDDDVDLAVFNLTPDTDAEFEARLEVAMGDAGLRMHRTEWGWQVYRDWSWAKIATSEGVAFYVDLFLYRPDPTNSDKLIQTEGGQRAFPKEFYLRNEVFPLKRGRFEDMTFSVPANRKPFLSRTYGPDWAKAGRITKLHPTNARQWVESVLLRCTGFYGHEVPLR